ncbi:MAG: hypothetical protein A2Z24_00305 [Candidatus Woykebacteria bacterium RBG_16_44_10]|uniref:Peptidase A2 domain-containing protein n=1 Tax=Candidatus Woykebacteria bacterium RBG_16_44_10 TaxID=1802597 RepID=A0A1G1WFF5_9BACT|nr:MAG: hypothetical protein A2Z24_00305 [Candidatus Woykebacteria bacterium RBG_16_44_10]
MERKDFRAFTVKANAKVNVLTTEIQLSLPYNPQADQGPAPALHNCKAIWDTGASMSSITEAMVNKLALKPTGRTEVTNTSGTETKNTYLLNVYLPNKVALSYLKVVECKNIVGDFEFLVGMDIIGAGDFAVTNVDGKTTMSYRVPSIETIDYVEQAEKEKLRRLGESRNKNQVSLKKYHKKKQEIRNRRRARRKK